MNTEEALLVLIPGLKLNLEAHLNRRRRDNHGENSHELKENAISWIASLFFNHHLHI